MTERINREIRLKSRPAGEPTEENFELVEAPVPAPAEGQFLVRNIWMSVDPYMRSRMREVKSYAPPFEIGQALDGGCVGQVVESNNPHFEKGAYVSSMMGWREYWLSDGTGVHVTRPDIAPIQTFLGVLGMTGLTAYAGLLRIGKLREGENVFVSGAAGAVGSVACQIAKAMKCRVVGSAGSDEKVQWLLDEAGVDAAFNYKTAQSVGAELDKALPEGIDVYFDNVGGDHLEDSLARMRKFGRVAACGMISQYNEEELPAGPKTLVNVIPKRVRIQGFIVGDHRDMARDFQVAMATWIEAGQMKWRETVVEGLENAPKALIGLFHGDNIGKMLVKLGPDPAPEVRAEAAGQDTIDDQDALPEGAVPDTGPDSRRVSLAAESDGEGDE